MVGNLLDYLPVLVESAITKKQQINHLSSSFNSALSNTVSKIGQIKTNLIYSIKHSDVSSRKEIQLAKGSSTVYLLGQEYSYQDQYKFLFQFRNTFRFTYRKGIKDIETDNGWGCMIRAVQMLFAEVLKRHLKLKNTQKDQCEVIRHFSEQSDGVLSLSAVCQQGQINKRWTSAPQIFTHFKNIMSRYPDNFTFYFEVYSSGLTFKQEQQVILPSYPAMISLSNRVSIECIPQELHKHYFQLMRHKNWVGTIGGLNGQALYIIGSQQNRVIYLDPHKVQSNDEELEVETYFQKTPRGIELSALSPSLSFCFYFNTKEEHLEWINWMSQLCETNHPNLVFLFMSKSAKNRAQKLQKQHKSAQLAFIPSPQMIPQDQPDLSDFQVEIVQRQYNNSDDFEVLQ